ncbi:MAG: hypothetical protein GKR96_08400 [Gammaproteobacteria bacterium]|nr:hypothetical protein [Gammaproteobacteria bacterium]
MRFYDTPRINSSNIFILGTRFDSQLRVVGVWGNINIDFDALQRAGGNAVKSRSDSPWGLLHSRMDLFSETDANNAASTPNI